MAQYLKGVQQIQDILTKNSFMKKMLLVTGIIGLMATTSVNAQTDTTKPVTTTAETTANKDKYNNWSADAYKLQAMPEGLTTEKIFPVLGKYELKDKEGNANNITISLDPSNKGLVWIEGLSYGTIKATLRQSPSTYKIPAQKIGEEADAKDVAEGVLIYDKDANVLSVCVGCTYNAENPAVAFLPVVEEEAVAPEKTTKKASAKTSKVAVKKIVPVHYTGSKIIEETAVTPVITQE